MKDRSIQNCMKLTQLKDGLSSLNAKYQGKIFPGFPPITANVFVERLLPDQFQHERFLDKAFSSTTTRSGIFNGKPIGVHAGERILQLLRSDQEWYSYLKNIESSITDKEDLRLVLNRFLVSSAILDFQDKGVDGNIPSKDMILQAADSSDLCPDLLCFSIFHLFRLKDEQEKEFRQLLYNQLDLSLRHSRRIPYTDTSNDAQKGLDLCLQASEGFLRNDVKYLLTCDESLFNLKWDLYDSFFGTICTNFDQQRMDTPLSFLYTKLLESSDSPAKKKLYIEGPSGSDRILITQLLFIRLIRDYRSNPERIPYLPLYISLNSFERQTLSQMVPFPSEGECRRFFEDQLKCNLNTLEESIRILDDSNIHKLPILFIDGVRNYETGIAIDNLLLNGILRWDRYNPTPSDHFSMRERLNYIYNIDIDPIPEARTKTGQQGHRAFKNAIKINSVLLHDEHNAKVFLNLFYQIKKEYCDHHAVSGGEYLYRRLKELTFFSIDSYQLYCLIPSLALPNVINIVDIYYNYCFSFFEGDADLLYQAKEAAHRFMESSEPITYQEYYYNATWRLFRRHASFIDYFAACYYVDQFRHIIGKANDTQTLSIDDLEQVNKILPKSITRFVSKQICSDQALAQSIIKLVRVHFDKLNIYLQSEMTYWLGRFKNERNQMESADLLDTLFKRIETRINNDRTKMSINEYRDQLFLLRGVSVSIIVNPGTDRKIATAHLNNYIESLLSDPVANEINRGFHLEYYGDLHYDYTQTGSLYYKDDARYGKHTLDSLLSYCVLEPSNLCFELWLYTLCSLLQRRMVISNYKSYSCQPDFDLRYYVKRMLALIKQRMDFMLKNPLLREYYRMMLEDGQRYLNQGYLSIDSDLYNTYSGLMEIPRTGWIEHGIASPESIAEHMYNAWLMAFFFLPDAYSDNDSIIEDPSYDKNIVLKMLLLHDAAEVITGDIQQPIKELNREKYDKEENEAMMSKLLLKGTYPDITNMYDNYILWKQWQAKWNSKPYNARIAKDIDILQSIHQLLTYLKNGKGDFSKKKICDWVREYKRIQTKVGKRLYYRLVLFNPSFSELRPWKYFSASEYATMKNEYEGLFCFNG